MDTFNKVFPNRLSFLFVSLIVLCAFNFQLNAQVAKNKADINAYAFIQEKASSWNLQTSDLEDMITSDSYLTQKTGITHHYIQQAYNGIPVYQSYINLALDHDLNVVAAKANFISSLKKQINVNSPDLTAQEALQMAAGILGIQWSGNLEQIENPVGSAQMQSFEASDLSAEAIPVKLRYVFQEKGLVKLAWDIVINQLDGQHWWSIRIDAITGELIDKYDWLHKCNFTGSSTACTASGAHFHSPIIAPPLAAPAPNEYLVFASPIESPNHGGRSIVSSPWLDAGNGGTLGWHDNGSSSFTTTRGNNVWATEDRADTDSGGNSPSSPSLDFNYPLDLTQSPTSNEDAIITNLFYWTNLMHDVWYQYGFDEPSGNFQNNNLNRGGFQSDYLAADAMDGSSTNNANFGTGPDGSSARLQMFEFTSNSVASILEVNSPNSIAGSFGLGSAIFGPTAPTTGLTGELVFVDDGSAAPTEACNALLNNTAINGKIAVADRGNCTFVQKAQNAQAAGAIALLVCNNVAGGFFNMSGTDGSITIPVVMLSQEDCATIRVEVPTVNVTISSTSVNRDSSLDSGIVCHEYGHGISIRLSGGPSTANCLTNLEQMGEGWSDWFGLMMTIEPGDTGPDGRGIGTYSEFQSTAGLGIRPARYSTDLGINPATYNDIAVVSIPHGVGFVWSTMLWDMTWSLIDQYGFDPDLYNGTGGNNIAMQLVIDGLKLQSCNPGFVDARDGILLADSLNNGAANSCLIWEAFANRGLGFSASQGSNNDVADGTEAYDKPPACSDIVLFTKKALATEVEQGQNLGFELNAINFTSSNLNTVSVNDNLPNGLDYIANSSSCGLNHSAGNLTSGNFGLNTNDSFNCTFQVTVNTATTSTFFFEDDVENGTSDWTLSNDIGNIDWSVSSAASFEGSNAWFVPNIDTQSDVFLSLAQASPTLNGNAQLRFHHAFNTEATWDGGVVEVSTDGNNWTDLGPNIIQNGYNSTITTNPDSNISGRAAFSGTNNGFKETIVDLNSFIGQQIFIRFRFTSDAFVGGTGWFIDQIRLLNAVEITNEACVDYDGGNTVCSSTKVLILPATTVPAVCQADGGDLVEPNGFSYPITICQGEDIAAFSTNFSAADETMPPSDYDAIFLLASMATGETIIQTEVSGNFDFSNLAPGTYRTAAFSYGPSNSLTLNTYLQSISQLTEIESDITNGFICADLSIEDEADNKTDVIVNALPQITSINSSATEICAGEVVDLEVLASNSGSQTFSYNWTQIVGFGGLTNASAATATFISNPNDDGTSTFSIEVEDQIGCRSTEEVSIMINPQPEILSIDVATTTICTGEQLSLEAIITDGTIAGDYSYNWTIINGPGGLSGSTSPQATFNAPNFGISTTELQLSVSDDKGCSTTETISLSTAPDEPSFQAKVFLEGAMLNGGSTMSTELNQFNLLPTNQPYSSAPWNYNGTENMTSFAPEIVDWILIEILHQSDSTQAAIRAFLLEESGNIFDPIDMDYNLNFSELSCNEAYFVAIRHRNHLAIMTDQAQLLDSNTTLIDFRQATQVDGGQNAQPLVVNLGNGFSALRGGDANANGSILVDDLNLYLSESSALNDYVSSDFNLNRHVTVADFNKLLSNTSLITSTPLRY